MTKRRLKKKLRAEFGLRPNTHYFAGDMEKIRRYFDYRRDRDADEFFVDDITSADLELALFFKRINSCQTTPGEQYLYYMLRSPATRADTYEKRRKIIGFMEAEPEKRLGLQTLLARLGRNRVAAISDVFSPEARAPFRLIAYILLAVALLGVIGYTIWALIASGTFIPWLLFLLPVNSLIHEYVMRKSNIKTDVVTVNYCIAMVITAEKLQKQLGGALSEQLEAMRASLSELKALSRLGVIGVELSNGDLSGGLAELLNTFLLLDLISYEFAKQKLGKKYRDIFTIHEHIGILDSAISIASYRRSIGNPPEPELDFSPSASARLYAEELCHPLLEHLVPVTVELDRCALVTGSNASGKSTFLRTIAISAIMAQSICTCRAAVYRAGAMRIYSSMALSDNMLAGESYYVTEIKSLKRILDTLGEGNNTLCVVDEVLRGTNTIERIAASSQTLACFRREGVICVAATHDIELCSLLAEGFELFHFQETVSGGEMSFDYTLRSGPATSRNAIKLLGIMGFEKELVERAEARARYYAETGIWK